MASPLTLRGMRAAPSTRSFRPLASIGPRHRRKVWASVARRSKSTASTVIRPAPILE